jgi:hypothetical protein
MDAWPERNMEGEVVSALDAAGLLVTDLHRRAMEACELYAIRFKPSDFVTGSEGHQALTIGRESLAAKEAAKPKPRWQVHQRPAGSSTRQWAVTEYGPTCYVATFESETDARAYAEDKNRGEAAK